MENLNCFEKGLLKYLPSQCFEKLISIKIGIAGCGGIGSNCASTLVRCGFRQFLLVDSDRVEASNLNRQFYTDNQVGYLKVEMLQQNLLEINNKLLIQTCQKQINSENIKSILGPCDVIVEAFDNVSSKKLLTQTFLHTDKLIVTVSGMGGYGDCDSMMSRQIKDTFFMVGDFTSEVTDRVHPYAPKTKIAAAKQADIIFNYYMQDCTHCI